MTARARNPHDEPTVGMTRRSVLAGLAGAGGLAGLPVGLSARAYANPVPTPLAFSEAALERTRHSVRYDGSYRRIPYPGGDVPADIGVCTDVIIRVYRVFGIDLQRLVHEDMRANFDAYPKLWGLTRPDPNIDHRRVPNLEVFFARRGTELPVTRDGRDYKTGDLVTWRLGQASLPHIGIATHRRTRTGSRPLIVHNIGEGPKLEDMLFDYAITRRFRFGLTAP